jgi:hypothetical protein
LSSIFCFLLSIYFASIVAIRSVKQVTPQSIYYLIVRD